MSIKTQKQPNKHQSNNLLGQSGSKHLHDLINGRQLQINYEM